MAQRRTRKGDESYRRLLSAATDELVASGGVCELARVAARAGVSMGLPYRYFGSKGGMVAAVVGDFFDRLDLLLIQKHASTLGWAVAARARMNAWVDFIHDDPLGPIVFARLIAEPEVVDLQLVRTSRLIDLACKAIDLAKREGMIPEHVDTRVAAAMLTGGTRQLMVTAISGRPPIPRQRTKTELWRATCRILEIDERQVSACPPAPGTRTRSGSPGSAGRRPVATAAARGRPT